MEAGELDSIPGDEEDGRHNRGVLPAAALAVEGQEGDEDFVQLQPEASGDGGGVHKPREEDSRQVQCTEQTVLRLIPEILQFQEHGIEFQYQTFEMCL